MDIEEVERVERRYESELEECERHIAEMDNIIKDENGNQQE